MKHDDTYAFHKYLMNLSHDLKEEWYFVTCLAIQYFAQEVILDTSSAVGK